MIPLIQAGCVGAFLALIASCIGLLIGEAVATKREDRPTHLMFAAWAVLTANLIPIGIMVVTS